jgi:dienelactone hydrolase
MNRLLFVTLLIGSLFSMTTHAKIITEEINYSIDKTTFKAYLAYDDSKGKRPGVLIVHEWWGHNNYARNRAEMLAKEGYTALALDMYGSGKLATHPDNANTFMMEVFNNMPAAEQRFDKAFDLLNSHKATQKDHIAAIGYCFGGAIVLHMARIGKPLAAVASFHGSLGSNLPADTKPNVKGVISVFTGANDGMIPATQVSAFTQEMFEANVNFSVQVYPNTMHSFTNPNADKIGKTFDMPLAYNAEADKDSWQKTLVMLGGVFK